MNANTYLKSKIADTQQLSKKRRRLERTMSQVTVVEEPPLLTEKEIAALTKKNASSAAAAAAAPAPKNVSSSSSSSTSVQKADVDVNKLTIYVRSSDGKKKYNVDICYKREGITFECNCGDQFGLKEKRNHCKHVATAIVQMNKTFLDSHIKGDKIQAVNKDAICQIVDLLEKFDFN